MPRLVVFVGAQVAWRKKDEGLTFCQVRKGREERREMGRLSTLGVARIQTGGGRKWVHHPGLKAAEHLAPAACLRCRCC
jgi:hypothetical protein